ncbi:MAG: hypothetical protein A2836_03030 [Candidatus Taylorbacteria bacterium RIFCSPHIGHO2_01_FULL_45_63]|uniref:2-oxoglutarate dehydrogenase n=1 Tax=Candidatus Taylorbacteria bacterium RIFCSPHIGHO2_02_FULL_45_35 TaxID=1802311 RepID=A0A1G2MW19_9BACT|nr:MAG: hypothetical protein A2836_03030 [Candidatus Taylorbacteria bacterium RIFCSPHIGHO2_01_FULL_45_63]OHA28025.1 MAG: hypothetical protein A3D56_00280 [Candidatus Taylorbacteria bacterium RIFCSPHIGHO2_02_FULL_45_35]OHA34965.1 MAG: hypothetical protein A3A22_00240 [Candidatus Taylorbacteria bacterium RIFCSPLOWO2_01_FULL_45_34b]
MLAFFAKQAFLFSFIIALGSTLVSLYYSLIIGFTPCDLCWYQRIFMYPLVILFGIALWKKDNGVIKYGLALSSVGAIIAFYNSYLQYGGSPLLPCGIDVNAVSCGVRYIFEFGYVTLPLMSLTGFVFIVTILFLRHRQK